MLRYRLILSFWFFFFFFNLTHAQHDFPPPDRTTTGSVGDEDPVEHDEHNHGEHVKDDGKASVFHAKSEMEGGGDQGGSGGRALRSGLRLFVWGPVTERVIKRHRIKTLYLLFVDLKADWGDQECRPVFEKVARQFKSREILHIIVPSEHIQPFQFFLGDDPQNDLPFGIIVEVNKGFKKYRLAAAESNIPDIPLEARVQRVCTETALSDFETLFFDGAWKPWLRSEDEVVTTYEENPDIGGDARVLVHSLSGRQFNDKVINTPGDALVLFYAPWCGHCKKFQRKFKDLADKFDGVEHLHFFQVDATKNDVDHPTVNVDRVPYVRYFKEGDKLQSIKFDHAERDVVEYGTHFIAQHSSQPIDEKAIQEMYRKRLDAAMAAKQRDGDDLSVDQVEL